MKTGFYLLCALTGILIGVVQEQWPEIHRRTVEEAHQKASKPLAIDQDTIPEKGTSTVMLCSDPEEDCGPHCVQLVPCDSIRHRLPPPAFRI
jgi:hypothetical protein